MSSKAGRGEVVSMGASNSRFGNQAVDGFLTKTERTKVIADAALKLEELFDVLQIDHRNDHNMRDTPARVAKMFVEEILHGRFVPPPKITEFDNVENCDQLIVTGPIDVRSTCAHHLMPIYGECYIGIVPSPTGKIIGLSKYDRLVDYFSSRFQIQEELVKQIERHIVEATAPRGLAIRISAVHMCKTHRGVRASHDARMVTTSYFGAIAEDRDLKQEFLQECASLQR